MSTTAAQCATAWLPYSAAKQCLLRVAEHCFVTEYRREAVAQLTVADAASVGADAGSMRHDTPILISEGTP